MSTQRTMETTPQPAGSVPRLLKLLGACALALTLGGCSVGVGGTIYDDGHHSHYHQHYVVGFSAVVVGGSYAPATSLDCLCSEQVELRLSLENAGPLDDRYFANDGRSHRFVVYDDWGHAVWDSWHWHVDSGLHESWDVPLGATITFSERWNLSDDHGHALPPGRYTVRAWFTGSLQGGDLPANPPPVVVEILPDGVG